MALGDLLLGGRVAAQVAAAAAPLGVRLYVARNRVHRIGTDCRRDNLACRYGVGVRVSVYVHADAHWERHVNEG